MTLKFNYKHQSYVYTQKPAWINAFGVQNIKSIKQLKCQVPALPECFSFHLFWHSEDTARKRLQHKNLTPGCYFSYWDREKDKCFPRFNSVDGCSWFLKSLSEIIRDPDQMARNSWAHLSCVCVVLFQQDTLWELG